MDVVTHINKYDNVGLILQLGPMYAGKTTKLLNTLNDLCDNGCDVLYINHSIDNRETTGTEKNFTTHNDLLHYVKTKFKQIKTDSLKNIWISIFKEYDIITIINKECHNNNFYNKSITDFCNLDEVEQYSLIKTYDKLVLSNANNNKGLTIIIDKNNQKNIYDDVNNIIYLKTINSMDNLSFAIYNKYNAIGIDEGQFFNDLLFVKDIMLKLNKKIIISSLHADANLNNFGHVHELLGYATKIKILTSKCARCALNNINGHPLLIKATTTYKLELNKDNTKQVDVGARSKYIPLCIECHKTMDYYYANEYSKYERYYTLLMNKN